VRNVIFGRSTQTYSMNSKSPNILDVGGNDGSRAKQSFPDSLIFTIDKKMGWNIDHEGLPNGNYDIIFANHIIEHLQDPDKFLEECKRVMTKDMILEIGTPNLTAWFNRILFLFGYVPRSVELSKKFNVGKAFNWNFDELGGHVFVYSVPAIVKLLKLHGFTVFSVVGEASTAPCNIIIRHIDRLMTWINPSLASAVRIKCRYIC